MATNCQSRGGREAFIRGGGGHAGATTTYVYLGNAVVGRGGSVAYEGPRPQSQGGQHGLTISYACLGCTGEGGRNPEVAEVDAKREVGANIEEVK